MGESRRSLRNLASCPGRLSLAAGSVMFLLPQGDGRDLTDAERGQDAVPTTTPRQGQGGGLRRIRDGALVGFVAGAIGLALPLTLIVVASDGAAERLVTSRELVQLAALMTLISAVLFAVSLLLYRAGFARLRVSNRPVWLSTILCGFGTVGVILLVLPTIIALTGSDALLTCIQAAPSGAIRCLGTVAPVVGFEATIAGWLLWAGGLGIVVGLSLSSVQFRDHWLALGAALYAVILLVLVGPLVGPIAHFGGSEYGLLGLPVLALIAPLSILMGAGPMATARPRARVDSNYSDPTVG